MHPLAFPDNRSGANGMRAGDRVLYTIDGRRGVVDEFMHDGEAFVTFDGGKYEVVKWHHLRPEPMADQDWSAIEVDGPVPPRSTTCY